MAAGLVGGDEAEGGRRISRQPLPCYHARSLL